MSNYNIMGHWNYLSDHISAPPWGLRMPDEVEIMTGFS